MKSFVREIGSWDASLLNVLRCIALCMCSCPLRVHIYAFTQALTHARNMRNSLSVLGTRYTLYLIFNLTKSPSEFPFSDAQFLCHAHFLYYIFRFQHINGFRIRDIAPYTPLYDGARYFCHVVGRREATLEINPYPSFFATPG